MKNLDNNMFEISKTTMRDLTPYEVAEVGGGADDKVASVLIVPVVITTSINTGDPC